jgi:drug/metabolite transporter (DMT)-like permease
MSSGSEKQRTDVAAKAVLPGPLRGALWMVFAAFSFAAMTTLIRKLSNDMHPFELAFFRSLFGLLVMLPWFLRAGFGALKTGRLGLHGFRALVGLVSMLLWFLALSLMPIAEATALNFTAPLFATIGAAVFLGEKVKARRWGATVAGFIGALIIVRPEGFDLGFATTLVLVASACMSMAVLSVKSLSRTESSNTIVLYMGLIMTPMSLIPALLYWTAPQPTDYLWFVAIGLFATIGQISMAKAFASADISAVLPFDFSRLLFVAAFGFLLFGEAPDMWTWVGAAIIFSATLYTAHRESRAARVFRSVQADLIPAAPNSLDQGKEPRV